MSTLLTSLFLSITLLGNISEEIKREWNIKDYLKSSEKRQIDESYFYGDWFIYGKANNKYRTSPLIKTKNNYYSFKKNNSLTIFFNNKKYKGSWVLSKNNKLILKYNGNEYIYRISHHETDFVVLAYLNTYLSLKKMTF